MSGKLSRMARSSTESQVVVASGGGVKGSDGYASSGVSECSQSHISIKFIFPIS